MTTVAMSYNDVTPFSARGDSKQTKESLGGSLIYLSIFRLIFIVHYFCVDLHFYYAGVEL